MSGSIHPAAVGVLPGSSPAETEAELYSPRAGLRPVPHTVRAGTARRGIAEQVGLFFELSKARLSGMVVLTTLVGFVLAGSAIDWVSLAWTLLGTTAAALAANAMNQCIEIERDRRMHRTAQRPLPSGALNTRQAWIYAVCLAVAGPAALAVNVNWLAAALAAGCLLLYVLVYTPLKVITPANTLVGAVVGAMPPLIGWVAASGRIELGGWLLALILFLWQIPHFLALAWMYREDYQRGGFRMLPLFDPSGTQTCQAVLLYSLALLPVTLYLFISNVLSAPAAIAAALAVAILLVAGWRLYKARDLRSARRLFLASIIYLPLVLGIMLADRGLRGAHLPSPPAPAVAAATAAPLSSIR